MSLLKDNKWYLNDSKLCYLTDEQAKDYLALTGSKEYSAGMHDAETMLISNNIDMIVSGIHEKAKLFDLGCGDALKTIDILKHARKRGKDLDFYLVDINQIILKTAMTNSRQAGFNPRGFQSDFCRFEYLVKVTRPAPQTVVYLGANYVNKDPSILANIRRGMQSGDLIYFSAQNGDGDIERILKQYDNLSMRNWLFHTVKKLGFRPDDVQYFVGFNHDTSDIEMKFRICDLPEKSRCLGFDVGDELVVATSRKPTLDQFRRTAEEYFSGQVLFSPDRSYVAFLGQK
ncbi:L-histidine N(alpha)-methyltransferase [Candidatus Woesearchaeota archaeon]|nr:L-histidine N(alpha)-methyltransferase [Candidatus Woesearchaeota archaeon]